MTDEQIDEIAAENNVYEVIEGAVLCDPADIRAFARAILAAATMPKAPAKEGE